MERNSKGQFEKGKNLGHKVFGGFSSQFKKGHKDLVPKEKRGHNKITRQKISQTQRIKNKDRVPNLIKKLEREWKKKIRLSFQWKDWRKSVFERDNYTCQDCKIRGKKLEPHHIIPIKSDLNELFNTKNGITLCRPCHIKTFGKELDFRDRYISIIEARM